MHKTLKLIALHAFCLRAASMATADAAQGRPNILVIMSDEHNAGVMGCAGNTIIRTPNLDALAARGIRFEGHYCSSPICTPSRQSFTTGKYLNQHNVWGNNQGVPQDAPSLPRVMQAAGYETYLIGKMHYFNTRNYGFTVLDKGPYKPSADKPEKVAPRRRLRADEFPDHGTAVGKEFSPMGPTAEEDMESFVDVGRRKRAVSFLQDRAAGGKPFFLVVGFIAPHYPLQAPPEYVSHYIDKVPPPEVPPGYLQTLPLNYRLVRNDRMLEKVPPYLAKLAREAYYAQTEWCDFQIGAVLDALKHSPFADNTVVIYTSDHGENLGEHGLWWKNALYDSADRIPLIISWPRRWAGGQVRAGASQTVDLVRTIVALGGGSAPSDWRGDSMVPWLDHADFHWKDRAVSEYYADYIASGITMIREGEWKYVYHARPNALRGPEEELYNLHDDPKELHNLAHVPEQQPRLRTLHADLVKELGEDPEITESRWREGATPEHPQGLLANR